MPYPTNITLHNGVLRPNFDSAPIESIALHSMGIGTKSDDHDITICVFREGRAFMSLPRYHQEFGTTTRFSWGTDGVGADQLAYAIVRFVTNDEELTLKLYRQFKYREIMLYQSNFEFSMYELQLKILDLAKWAI